MNYGKEIDLKKDLLFGDYIPLVFKQAIIRGYESKTVGSREYTIEEVVKKTEYTPIIIIGESGLGKTTALLKLKYDIRDQENFLPIYVDLGKFIKKISLLEFIKKYSNQKKNVFIDLFNKGKFFVLLDALDQAPEMFQRDLITEFEEIINGEFSSLGNKIILTCRLSEYPKQLNRYFTVEIQLMSLSKLKSLLKDKLGEEGLSLYQKMTKSLRELCRNPLHLSMILDIYKKEKLPRNRATLYKFFINKVLFDWENVKIVERKDKLDILAWLAYKMNSANKTFMIRNDAEDVISEKLAQINKARKDSNLKGYELQTVMRELLKDGLIVYSDQMISFKHHSLQEYFAACEIREKKIEEKFIENSQWHETLIFVSGLKQNSNNLVKKILNKGELLLAAKCIVSANKIKVSVVDEVVERLIKQLHEPEPWEVYEFLLELEERAKIYLLIYAKTDEPIIRRRCAFALGKMKAYDLADELCKLLYDQDPHTRYHVIRSLGEIKNEVSITFLIDCLDDQDPNVVAIVKWALEQFEEKAIEGYINKKELSDIGKEVIHGLIKILKEAKNPEIRAHAASNLAFLRDDSILDILKSAFQKEHDEYVLSRLAIAIAKIGLKEIPENLALFLYHCEKRWVYNFIYTLDKVGGLQSIPYLKLLDKYPDPAIREFCQEIISKIETERERFL